MAKNDNLQDFLRDVANAIRNKKGTSNLINPQNFSSEIESIESSSFNAELFYGFWRLKKDNKTYVLKVYDTGKLDYEIYTSSPAIYTDISYTIINDTIEFQFVSGGSIDDIEITVKTFKYENDTLIDTSTNDIYSHILFSDGTLSVTKNGSYRPAKSNGFNMVQVNVQGGDYDIDVVYNDDDTQSLYITDSDTTHSYNSQKYIDLIQRTVTNVTIPTSVSVIGNSAFQSCVKLKSVTLHDGIEKIGTLAFMSCSLLAKITLPKSIKSIENGTFNGCRSLAEISIPDSVSTIRSNVFRSCESLANIKLPPNLIELGTYAFYGCSKLTEMTILATTPPTLSNTNAISTATTTIYIPAGTLSAYQSATNWSSFASKFVELEV